MQADRPYYGLNHMISAANAASNVTLCAENCRELWCSEWEEEAVHRHSYWE